MQCAYGLTPHGRRTPDLAQLRSRRVHVRPEDSQPATVNKWQVFRDVCAARNMLGLRDRALAVLNALLSFHPDVDLGAQAVIVFPSNSQLTARTNGIAGATLRRAIAALVAAGVICRNDSPNGKRYARRNGAGDIEHAFGFDLTPLRYRAAEFGGMAEKVRAQAAETRNAREAFSLCRRDVRKLIAAAISDGEAGDWPVLQAACDAIICSVPRTADISVLKSALVAMEQLRSDVLKALNIKTDSAHMGASERQYERHKESQNPESHIEVDSDSGFLKAGPETVATDDAPRVPPPPLDMVLRACPQIIAFSRGQHVGTWRDLHQAAELASRMLGIGKAAWSLASQVMGPESASTTIAHILERHDVITNPGGYLNRLTVQARTGHYEPANVLLTMLSRTSVGSRVTPAF